MTKSPTATELFVTMRRLYLEIAAIRNLGAEMKEALAALEGAGPLVLGSAP